jgi:hypothetical protein
MTDRSRAGTTWRVRLAGCATSKNAGRVYYHVHQCQSVRSEQRERSKRQVATVRNTAKEEAPKLRVSGLDAVI